MESLFKNYCRETDLLREEYFPKINSIKVKYQDVIDNVKDIEEQIEQWVGIAFEFLNKYPNNYYIIDWEELRKNKVLSANFIYPGEDEDDEWCFATISVPTESILEPLDKEKANLFVKFNWDKN